MTLVSRLIIGVLQLLQKAYKACISPMLGDVCRFEPSCSDYCIEALREHGLVKGAYLGIRRLARCHALNPGGFDPVPQRSHDGK